MSGRDLCGVIDRMAKIVPALRSELQNVKDSVPFTAPEAMYLRWRTVSIILTKVVPADHPKFKQISDIFSAKEN